jgi:GDP-L-fucose synthase
MNKDAKIYIAGHSMVGSAIWRTLTAKGYTNLIGLRARTGFEKPTSCKDFMAAENRK